MHTCAAICTYTRGNYCLVVLLNLSMDTKPIERLIFHVFQPRRRRCWGRKQKEKAHIKPHEIIIKRSEPAINAFQWHIMIDSVCRRNLFPAGLWPLDHPYIIHINIDSCASQRQHTCHICTCRFNLALTLRDMPLAPPPPPCFSSHLPLSFWLPAIHETLCRFLSRVSAIMLPEK